MKGIATIFGFALLATAGTSSALAANPTLEVAPSLVFNGQTANVYGTMFCPTSPSCSTVTIAVESKQVASGVQVGSDGKFHATFTVSEFSGTHRVTASQNGALQATAGMTVALTDSRKPSPTPPGGGAVNPPTSQPGVSQPPNPNGTATPTDSLVADASPAVQPTATNGGPLSAAAGAVSAPLNVWIAILLLLLVAGAVVAVIAWRRRRESG